MEGGPIVSVLVEMALLWRFCEGTPDWLISGGKFIVGNFWSSSILLLVVTWSGWTPSLLDSDLGVLLYIMFRGCFDQCSIKEAYCG